MLLLSANNGTKNTLAIWVSEYVNSRRTQDFSLQTIPRKLRAASWLASLPLLSHAKFQIIHSSADRDQLTNIRIGYVDL